MLNFNAECIGMQLKQCFKICFSKAFKLILHFKLEVVHLLEITITKHLCKASSEKIYLTPLALIPDSFWFGIVSTTSRSHRRTCMFFFLKLLAIPFVVIRIKRTQSGNWNECIFSCGKNVTFYCMKWHYSSKYSF